MEEGRASFGRPAPSSAPSMRAAFAQKLLILLNYMTSSGSCDMNLPPGSQRSAPRDPQGTAPQEHGKPPGRPKRGAAHPPATRQPNLEFSVRSPTPLGRQMVG